MNIAKVYSKTSPCINCPFRTDVEPYLPPQRRAELSGYSEPGAGAMFPCHKTTSLYGNGKWRMTAKTRICAGHMIHARHLGGDTQSMQLAERLCGADLSKLDMSAPVFTTRKAMVTR